MTFTDGKHTPPLAANYASKSISPESYHYLQQWIHRESGIVIDKDKSYLLQARLAPVLERENLASLETLCGRLRGGAPGVARQVVDAMTTNETLFFRDKAPFDALRHHIVPQLLTNRAERKLAFWSAAASSGQEAYSLAMLLLDMGLTSHEVDIFGSDLSGEILKKAELGIYGRFEVNRGLPPEYLDRYFDRLGADWQVKEHVRKMVRFQHLDLRSTFRVHGPFDVVLCRNVLIYFDAETKVNILREIRRSLTTGGFLLLGAAETAGSSVAGFQRTVFGQAVAYQAS